MPITIQATEGVMPPSAESKLFADVSETFLKLHNLSGNAFITPNVIGEVNVIEKGRSFAGGKPADIVIIELKVPSFGLASAEQKQAFVAETTDLVVKASGGRQPRNRIYVNMVYAVDGLWGIGGKTYTNAELGEAVSKG